MAPADVVAAFLAAYNARDIDACAELFADDVHLVHHGRDVDVAGRDAVIEMFRGSVESRPERRFTPPTRITSNGDAVIVEHAWDGGDVQMELVTIFTVDDGRITLYTEYG